MKEEGRGPSESATEAGGEADSPKPVFSMDSSMASWRVRWSSNPLSQNIVPGITQDQCHSVHYRTEAQFTDAISDVRTLVAGGND